MTLTRTSASINLTLLGLHSGETAMVCSNQYLTSNFLPRAYNDLPSVEDADVMAGSLTAIAAAETHLAPIFFRHGLQDLCGINLLHNHWKVDGDEIPQQRLEHRLGERALITRPASRDADSTPASWMICSGEEQGKLSAFEFSTDPRVSAALPEVQQKSEFFDEAWTMLRELGLQRVLGICILPREPLSDDPDCELFEVTGADERSSILVARVPSTETDKRYVQTCWQFRLASEADKDQEADAQFQCGNVSQCISHTVPVGPPNHVSKTKHEHIDID